MMKAERFASMNEALGSAQTFSFAWIRGWTSVYLGPVHEVPVELRNPKEWIEARFFGARHSDTVLEHRTIRELRFDSRADFIIKIELDDADETITRTCPIENRSRFGMVLEKTDLINYDEDGQASVVATLLTGWKGEEAK